MSPSATPRDRARGSRILLVGGGAFQLEIVRAAQHYGEVVVVDASPLAPALALADHPRLADINDVNDVVRIARELGVTHVVAAASDTAIPAVNAVVRALSLRGIPGEVAVRCRDKLACFRALARAGQNVPTTRAVDDMATAEAAVREVGGYPVIVKPRLGSGGHGVTMVRESAELATALTYARRAYGPGARGVLVQQFIVGQAVGVEAFFAAGELVQGFVFNEQFEADFISPAGHAWPSTLATSVERQVLAAVAAFAGTLGLRDGPANFDLRQVGEQTLLLEINPRLGGNGITDLVRSACDVDLAEASVRLALGHDPLPALAPKHTSATATRLILKHGLGTAHGRTAALKCRDHPDVLALDLMVNDGQPAHIRVGQWTILGRTLVRGADSTQAAQLAERVATNVAACITLSAD